MSGDRIRLTGMRLFARHGVLPSEAERGQVFVVDLDLGLDLRPAGTTDDLAATVDYGKLAAEVAAVVTGTRHDLVEAVAEDVARVALADPRVTDARVRVVKPHAPLPVDASVEVEIVREAGA